MEERGDHVGSSLAPSTFLTSSSTTKQSSHIFLGYTTRYRQKKVFFGNVPNNFGHLPEQYQVNRLDVYMGS